MTSEGREKSTERHRIQITHTHKTEGQEKDLGAQRLDTNKNQR